MAKKAKATAPAEPGVPTLLDALKHINVAQLQIGLPYMRHCVFYDHWVYGFDGTLSAGHKVQEDLTLAPQTAKLIQALERCDEHLAMATLPSGLSVKSGRFRAIVPCFPLSDMPPIAADPPIAPIDDRLRAGFAAVGRAVSDAGQFVTTAAVKLYSGGMCGTNRHVLIEYWHGIDLPTILIPKAAIKAIEAIKKPLAQFGFSATSATFYFDDGSWVKTQLYAEKYPNTDPIWEKHAKADLWPMTAELFDALKKIKPFVGEHNAVIFGLNEIHTEVNKETAGSVYEVPAIPAGQAFNIDYLLMLEGLITKVDYGKVETPMYFVGENVRGCVMPIKVK